MFKFLSSIIHGPRRRRAAQESDWGRRSGWFIEKDGGKIGELDYVRWWADRQFWHFYRVTWYKPEDAVTCPDAWIRQKLVLRNRRFLEVVIGSFMMSPGEGDEICIRGAYVPEELFGR